MPIDHAKEICVLTTFLGCGAVEARRDRFDDQFKRIECRHEVRPSTVFVLALDLPLGTQLLE